MEEIKNYIKNNVNKELKFIIDEGRSKKKLNIGRIKKSYPHIFTIIVDGKLLCFSYSDVLIKKIIFLN